MATVLIQHGEPGPDGTPPPRAYFQLIEGKLHMPTIRDYFRLANVALDGVVYPTDLEGFTFSTFAADTQARVTGDALPGGPRLTRILLIRTNEVYGEPDQSGGKRRVMQAEENLGLWTLPPREVQPRSLTELAAALRSFLQIEHAVTWLFKYRYQNELVPIVSDSALAGAFDYFRAQAAQSVDDEQCRLYLNTTSEEMAPRDIIRARISGILDAAAAHSAGRESTAAAAAPVDPALPASHTTSLQLQLPGLDTATAMALLGSHPQHTASALALAAFAPYGMQQQQHSMMGPLHSDTAQQEAGSYGMAGDIDGDDGEDGDMQGEGGLGGMRSLLGIQQQQQSGSEGATGPGGAGMGQLKKESKTRHTDGRFKNEAQHSKKMADMSRKIHELFDGEIVQMVQVVDHKKIMCLLCNHACTAYSAYHTDCVRKHFLRHHEPMLRERGVDVSNWRKEYEVSQKVKRQQQHGDCMGVVPSQQPMLVGGGIGGLLQGGGPQGAMPQLSLPALLNVLQANGGLDGEAAQRLFSSLDLHSLLAQQSANSAAAANGGIHMPSVSSLLMQAQAMSQHEQLQIQAAGALSGLMTAGSIGGSGSGGGAPGTTAGSLASQLSGALAGTSSAAVSLAPMARLASGTITTEMPLPPPPLPPPPPPALSPPPLSPLERPAQQLCVKGGGEPLLQQVGPMGLKRSASVASQGQGSLPDIRSPPVVTTDMGPPAAC